MYKVIVYCEATPIFYKYNAHTWYLPVHESGSLLSCQGDHSLQLNTREHFDYLMTRGTLATLVPSECILIHRVKGSTVLLVPLEDNLLHSFHSIPLLRSWQWENSLRTCHMKAVRAFLPLACHWRTHLSVCTK